MAARPPWFTLALLCSACVGPVPRQAPAPGEVATSTFGTVLTSTALAANAGTSSAACSIDLSAKDPIDAEAEADDGVAEEEESREAPPIDRGAPLLQYTADLSDQDLAAKWRAAPESLGSISVGFADEGRLINSMQFPCGDGKTWTVVSPENTWGTSETIGYVLAAVAHVKSLHPAAPPLRINQISAREGGYLRPHRSHQNGRDVDLAFYYPTAAPIIAVAREKVIDVALSWELLKSVVTITDVQLVLVDRHVQEVLYGYALRQGEDRAWLDSLFHAGKNSLVQHARRHRDHFHVRFFSPRAQELGRRVTPLLAQRPEHNLAMVRIKNGDTLGAIARRYKTSVVAIQKANHMKSSFLRLGLVLKISLRGPCTQCPIPPPLAIPPRRMPPAATASSFQTRTATSAQAAGLLGPALGKSP